MTDPRQAERERVARELVREYYEEDDPDIATPVTNKAEWLQQRIVALLKATEAEVLEEAAQLCDAMSLSTSHNLAVSLRFIAQERRP